jgi:predicted phage replisome organizer
MSDIRWIKVTVDMFEDNKIEFIRSLPDGDAIIVTWIQMLSIAGQSNMGGYLMVSEDIPYSEQLLSNKLRRQPVFLQFALETLTRLKMIDIEDGPFHITKWEKHQNVEGMEKVRIQTNDRVKKHRLKEKEKLETLQGNATVTLRVTQGNATELDIDKEKESNTTDDDVDRVFKAYCRIHNKYEMYETEQFRLIERKIKDGYSAKMMISVMEERHSPKVNSIKYYDKPFLEHQLNNKEAETQQRLADERKNNVIEFDLKPDPILNKAAGFND